MNVWAYIHLLKNTDIMCCVRSHNSARNTSQRNRSHYCQLLKTDLRARVPASMSLKIWNQSGRITMLPIIRVSVASQLLNSSKCAFVARHFDHTFANWKLIYKSYLFSTQTTKASQRQCEAQNFPKKCLYVWVSDLNIHTRLRNYNQRQRQSTGFSQTL